MGLGGDYRAGRRKLLVILYFVCVALQVVEAYGQRVAPPIGLKHLRAWFSFWATPVTSAVAASLLPAIAIVSRRRRTSAIAAITAVAVAVPLAVTVAVVGAAVGVVHAICFIVECGHRGVMARGSRDFIEVECTLVSAPYPERPETHRRSAASVHRCGLPKTQAR